MRRSYWRYFTIREDQWGLSIVSEQRVLELRKPFRYSMRTLLTITTIVAVIAMIERNYQLLGGVAQISAFSVMLVFIAVAVFYGLGFGVILPLTIVVATPVVLIAALFAGRPFVRAATQSYAGICRMFVKFLIQLGPRLGSCLCFQPRGVLGPSNRNSNAKDRKIVR